MNAGWNSISAELQTLIAAIVDDAGTGNRFVEVLEHPSNDFNGYPSAVILPVNMPSDYATNTHNQRSYTFDIFIYIKLDQLKYSEAFSRMRKYVDEVVNELDKSQDLGGHVGFVRPVPTEWAEAEVGGGTFLIGSLQAVCVVWHDIM